MNVKASIIQCQRIHSLLFLFRFLFLFCKTRQQACFLANRNLICLSQCECNASDGEWPDYIETINFGLLSLQWRWFYHYNKTCSVTDLLLCVFVCVYVFFLGWNCGNHNICPCWRSFPVIIFILLSVGAVVC